MLNPVFIPPCIASGIVMIKSPCCWQTMVKRIRHFFSNQRGRNVDLCLKYEQQYGLTESSIICPLLFCFLTLWYFHMFFSRRFLSSGNIKHHSLAAPKSCRFIDGKSESSRWKPNRAPLLPTYVHGSVTPEIASIYFFLTRDWISVSALLKSICFPLVTSKSEME